MRVGATELTIDTPCPRLRDMGTYVSIRGWLECDRDQLAAVKEIISAHDYYYSRGWGFPSGLVNSDGFVFYGGSIRESGVDWFLGQLREMAALPATDSDNDLVQGLFLASHEVNGMSEWLVRDGRVLITPADSRYAFFDE
ncbi:hypothetical protein GCM10029964_124670 [Kibdelosporangium lantanae]